MAEFIEDPAKFQEFDANFHFEIARATQNKILFRLINVIRGQIQTWIGERMALAPDRVASLAQTSLTQHQAIFEAIKARNGEAARSAMAHHIQTATDDLQVSEISKLPP